jgi:hypothetical protein
MHRAPRAGEWLLQILQQKPERAQARTVNRRRRGGAAFASSSLALSSPCFLKTAGTDRDILVDSGEPPLVETLDLCLLLVSTSRKTWEMAFGNRRMISAPGVEATALT